MHVSDVWLPNMDHTIHNDFVYAATTRFLLAPDQTYLLDIISETTKFHPGPNFIALLNGKQIFAYCSRKNC